MRRLRARSDEAGFTLIEAMASVAVMATVVATLATLSGQWLPHWRHGLAELQRAELLSLGVERVSADLAAAEYVNEGGAADGPLFDGTASSVTFVRSAIGPGSRGRLEIVRIAEIESGHGFALVRARKPFAPLADLAPAGFADPVVLVQTPVRVSFAYAGADRKWMGSWAGSARLPNAVLITPRDGADGRALAASTAVALHVTAPPQDESKTGSRRSALAAPATGNQQP
jgi:general secretion pathway protein J